MVRLPDGKKIEDMLIRFDRMYQRNRQTDRHTHTQTPHDGNLKAALDASIVRQFKKINVTFLEVVCGIANPKNHAECGVSFC